MTNRYMLIEGRQCSCGTSSSIAVYEDDIGLGFLKNLSPAHKYSAGDVVEILSLLHDVKVVVSSQAEYIHYGAEHITMLSRSANDGFEVLLMLLQLEYEWGYFDGFGARPEDQHNLAWHSYGALNTIGDE